ncbi:MAG: DinB family protein [Dehalococcoidia bacterium]|nr:DinB family protein [Dehalococcoidia bacterium]
MLSALRALADRLIWDVANVRYVAERLPRGGLDRRPAEGERTVREILAHLAASQQRFAQEAEALARGDSLAAANEATSGRATGRRPAPGLAESLQALAAARDATIAALEPVTAAQLDSASPDAGTVRKLLQKHSCHLAHHALDFADALPELRFDPMVLNWALYVDCTDDVALGRRQAKLLAEVRDRFAQEEAGDAT